MAGPPVTDKERAEICRHVMHRLRHFYPDIPETSRQRQTAAFELKTYQRATNKADYIDKIILGLLRAEPSAEPSADRPTPSSRLFTSSSSSAPSSPPPIKRARIAPSSASPPRSPVSPANDQSTDVALNTWHAAMTHEHTVDACDRLSRPCQSHALSQPATHNVTEQVNTRLRVLEQDAHEQQTSGQEFLTSTEGAAQLDGTVASPGVKRKAEGPCSGVGRAESGDNSHKIASEEEGALGNKGAAVGTNGSTATDVSSRLTGDSKREGAVRRGPEVEADWRHGVGERERGARVARAREELGKSSAWLAEERLMEDARTIERTAFGLARSLREYDEVINRSLGRPAYGGGMSWQQRMPKQGRAAVRLSMMRRLKAYMPLVDEKLVKKSVEAFESIAWGSATGAREYRAVIEDGVKIVEQNRRSTMAGLMKTNDCSEKECVDADESGREESGKDDDGVLEECDGSRGEQFEGGEGRNECVTEEQDDSWARLDEENILSGMGANSWITGPAGEDVFDLNYVGEPQWNLDVNESQIAV